MPSSACIPGIVCEVTVEEDGQSIRQHAGTGVLRVDPRRGTASMRNLDKTRRLRSSLLVVAGPALAETSEPPPSFRRDVMPVFFRAGCNSGGCHGAARGKDGFRLSLFGYDPDGDYFRLTQQIVGRRVDVASPDRSLLLAKATGKVPHTGGQLFKEDSDSLTELCSAGSTPGRPPTPRTSRRRSGLRSPRPG